MFVGYCGSFLTTYYLCQNKLKKTITEAPTTSVASTRVDQERGGRIAWRVPCPIYSTLPRRMRPVACMDAEVVYEHLDQRVVQ